ncbi:zona pellucida glycoprotein 2, like 2 [Pangasianodon hypophthalmus]|uniref:zona pellucida glycoprotein 2, like 2 n=1 Tax=Pangasianodon hypophthalmus TaxID=310915 RepID=UPI00230783D3|nr:zona pellucida glycoprotein 2, like 2 [Pangasianodon hypophthalmus]
MVGKVLPVLALVYFVLYASFCSAQVPKVLLRQMPSFQSARMSDHVAQSQLTQSGAIQQEGNLSQVSLPETNQSWQQIQKVSEASQLCEVAESSRVGCGEPGISPADCEALDCCYDNRLCKQAYDGPMCYYGKAVTVQCTMDGQFVLVISRDVTIPSINLDSISILEATGGPCTAVDSNDDFAIYQFPVTACGARTKVEGDFIVYENTMASLYEVGFGPHGAITRDSSFELTFQCRYLATAVEDLVVDVKTLPPPPPVVQQGALRVELRLANGACTSKGCSDADMYSSYYTEADYPVTKVLQDPVYVEVRILERTDPNIVLVLNHCWATSSPDSSSEPQWDLLVDGCPYEDDRYRTTLVPVSTSSGLQYPTHYRRFVVKMFTFVDKNLLIPQKEQLFIHCSTAVCQLSATESCEPSCHRTRRSVSATQDSGKKVLVSSGMVLFIADLPVSAKSQADGPEQIPQGIGYGLYGVAALTAMSVCVLLVAVLRRRPKQHPRLQITRL